jgi:hypothetical protein
MQRDQFVWFNAHSINEQAPACGYPKQDYILAEIEHLPQNWPFERLPLCQCVPSLWSRPLRVEDPPLPPPPPSCFPHAETDRNAASETDKMWLPGTQYCEMRLPSA